MSFLNLFAHAHPERIARRWRPQIGVAAASAVCEVLEPRQLLTAYVYTVPAPHSTVYLQRTDTPGQVQVRLDGPNGPIGHTFVNETGMDIVQVAPGIAALFVDQVPAAFKPRFDRTDDGIQVRGGGGGTLRVEAGDDDTLLRVTDFSVSNTTLEATDSRGNVGRSRLGDGVSQLMIRTNDVVAKGYYPNGGTDVIVPRFLGAFSLRVDTGLATYSRVTVERTVNASVTTGAGHNIVSVEKTQVDVDFGAGTGTGNGLGLGNVLNVHENSGAHLMPLEGNHVVAVDEVNVTDRGTLIIDGQSVISNVQLATGGAAIIMATAMVGHFAVAAGAVASIQGPVTVGTFDVDGSANFLSVLSVVDRFTDSEGTVSVFAGANVFVLNPSYLSTLILDGLPFPDQAFVQFQTTGSHVRTLTVSNGLVSLQRRASSPSSETARVLTVNTLDLHPQTPTDFTGLDLNDNVLIIDYAGATPGGDVQALVTSGYADGTWTGGGIRSGTAAERADTGIGYAEANELFTSFPATFAGHSVDNTSVLLRYTRYGDATLDGHVNLDDFDRLAANLNQTGRRWVHGDSSFDGTVNLADFDRLAANFGKASLPMGEDEDDVLPA